MNEIEIAYVDYMKTNYCELSQMYDSDSVHGWHDSEYEAEVIAKSRIKKVRELYNI